MKINRRSFLKTLLGGAAIGTSSIILANGGRTSLLPSTTNKITEHHDTPDDPKRHWGFLIDLSKCNGCEDQEVPEDDPTGEKPQCTYSCRSHHNYLNAKPPQYWIRVYRLEDNSSIDPYYFPKPCQNCEDPPCQRVCPTGATFKRKDGTVLIDNKICIGCRICMAACPYETRFFWFDDPDPEEEKGVTYDSPEYSAKHIRGTVSKCDYCVDNAYKGILPPCVSSCPRGVLYYGDLNEDAVSNGSETILLSKTLEKYGGYRYKEYENTKPSVFYLPPAGQNEIRADSHSKIELDVNHSIMYDNTLYIKLSAYSVIHDSPLQQKDVIFKIETQKGIEVIAEGKTNKKGIFDFNFKNKYEKSEIKIIAELKDEVQKKSLEVTVTHV